MRVEGTIPLHAVDLEVSTDDQVEALRKFRERFPEARPGSIDGEVIRGVCPCGRPIMLRDKNYTYSHDTEQYTCFDCLVKKEKL